MLSNKEQESLQLITGVCGEQTAYQLQSQPPEKPSEKNDQAFTKPTSTSCHTLAHCML